MGLFDFVKNAGEKLGLGKDEPAATPAATPAAAPAAAPAPTPEDIKRASDRRRAMGLVKHIAGLGFEVEELSVRVDGELATLGGTAKNQSDREKIVLAVGNVDGIARVDDQMEVAESEPEATFYTVQPGDSLSKIAKAHYGNAMKYPVIFEANKPLLTDPDKIYPGQVLRIPPLEG